MKPPQFDPNLIGPVQLLNELEYLAVMVSGIPSDIPDLSRDAKDVCAYIVDKLTERRRYLTDLFIREWKYDAGT